MRRRVLLKGLQVAATALAMPSLAAPQNTRLLKFVPQADLALLDPIQSPALVTIMHACMVFDSLYGLDETYKPRPQMLEGHTIENDGRLWRMTLREGLTFHDRTPVLARDAVASIMRWGKRDAFGLTVMSATDEISAPSDRVLQFRLKKPFPLLPDALGKMGAYYCAIMPERLAQTAPTTQITEMVGSGPYRFIAAERVPGSLAVWERNAAYVPCSEGVTSLLAGPKIAHFDRIEWHTIPDAATAAAALQSGEVDWWDQPSTDLLAMLRKNANVTVQVQDGTGFLGMVRPNEMQPPFNNPAIRRAVMGTINQTDFMMAVAGDDRAMWRDNVGFFHPASSLANNAGMAALIGPRDDAKAKLDLAAAGYKGERVVLLAATDIASLDAMAEVAGDTFRKIGLNVDYQSTDWGTMVQRLSSKAPVESGGWSAYTNFVFGASMVNPAANNYIRGNGAAAMFGWPDAPRLEELRNAWLDAPDLDTQKTIARVLQLQAFQDVPYWPTGMFFQATAFRSNISGVLRGFSLFYNVRRN
jgi:peptide/nickel transport system substrate-binding protein